MVQSFARNWLVPLSVLFSRQNELLPDNFSENLTILEIFVIVPHALPQCTVGSIHILCNHVRGALMWHFAHRGLYQCLMPAFARSCRTSTLIMEPFKFLWNSEEFKNKEHFSAQKLTELENFSLLFQFSVVNLSNTDQKYFKQSLCYHDKFWSSSMTTLNPLLNFPFLWLERKFWGT